jgi:hypothetical protein
MIIIVNVCDNANAPLFLCMSMIIVSRCNDIKAREFVSLSFSQDSTLLLTMGGAPDWTLVCWNWYVKIFYVYDVCIRFLIRLYDIYTHVVC